MSFHEILIAVMAGFAVLGATDRIFGNRWGLGKEFEEGKLSLEDVYAYAKQNGEPKQVSGKQELYEAILNMYC